jgi:hypothetical protein
MEIRFFVVVCAVVIAVPIKPWVIPVPDIVGQRHIDG